jgi:alpha-galactosidase
LVHSAAPLLAGNDLRNISPAFLAILTNREVIAVNQDKDGKQGRRLSKSGDAEVWTRPLSVARKPLHYLTAARKPQRSPSRCMPYHQS